MRKALISFVFIVVLLGMVGMASATSLSRGNGWMWTEWYPGVFYAIETGPTNPWSWMFSYETDITPIINPAPGWEYATEYTDGIFWFGDPLSSDTVTVLVHATVYSHDLHIYEGGKIELASDIDPDLFMTGMLIETNILTQEGAVGHEGTITDLPPTPAPEPATLLLLGFGLVGLAGIRRKYKS